MPVNHASHDPCHYHFHSPARHFVIAFAEKNFVSADLTDRIVAFFRIHYSVFRHSIVFFDLSVAVAAVVSSAAFVDFRTVSFRFVFCRNSAAPVVAGAAHPVAAVSFHFASGQNSFALVADAVFPVVVSFHSDVVQRHCGFAVAAAVYFFALAAGVIHFAGSPPGHDGRIDCCVAQFVAVAADAEYPGDVSFELASAPCHCYHYFAVLFHYCFDWLFCQCHFCDHYLLSPGFFVGKHFHFAGHIVRNYGVQDASRHCFAEPGV